jgi:ADP-heptose:LPS heptosyltransferase
MGSLRYRLLLPLTSNHVGNNLFCTPAIHLLKKHLRHLKIDVVALNRRGASVFEQDPDVGRLYRIRSRRSGRRLAARYDLAIGMHRGKPKEFLAGARGMSIRANAPDSTKRRAETILEFVQG